MARLAAVAVLLAVAASCAGAADSGTPDAGQPSGSADGAGGDAASDVAGAAVVGDAADASEDLDATGPATDGGPSDGTAAGDGAASSPETASDAGDGAGDDAADGRPVDVPPLRPDVPPELRPALRIDPLEVDFGYVAPGEVARRPVRLENVGEGVLVVRSVRLTHGSHPGVRLDGAPAARVEVAAGDSLTFDVVYEWPTAPPRDGDLLGTVLVVANHSVDDFGRIPVFARYEWPVARVLPKDELTFGAIAQGATGYRTVTIRNAGEAPLLVQALDILAEDGALDGEFGVEEAEDFPPTRDAGPGTVPPRSERVVTLRFTNLGPAAGDANGRLVVRTNDDLASELHVRLRAVRDGDATCLVVLEPEAVDFGTIREFDRRVRSMTVRNVGSGYCTYVGATITRCTGGAADPLLASCQADDDVDLRFEVVSAPPTANQWLPPGGRADLEVVYQPGEPESAAALLSVTIGDPYAEPGEPTHFSVPAVTAGDTLRPNLVGRCAECPMDLIPSEVDFGRTTVGCASPPQRVTVYTRDATLPLRVTRVEPGADCGPEWTFDVPAIPPAGAVVDVGSPFAVDLRFRPQTEGEARCDLVVYSTDPCRPVAHVPLVGVGTMDPNRTDRFTQEAVHEVDVLFVVDDSGSMCEEQDNLAANLASFIQHAQAWESDYRIGVVSVCVQPSACGGWVGVLRSDYPPERWVDRHSWSHFEDNVRLGCSGNSDSQEAGLEAVYLALSAPTNYLSQTSCHEDAYCIRPQTCLLDIRYCGGANGGFLREDAALEVVILSDEEDQSPRPVDYYVDFLKSLKGYVNDHMLHVHSIILEGAGARYSYVSAQTGGYVASIADQSFASALSELGDVAFGLRRRFFLSNYPLAGTVAVLVDGAAYAGTWEYDAGNNSVHLTGDATTLPQEGQTIEIAYEVACEPGV